jgi:orotate phosphoribosyltransferase
MSRHVLDRADPRWSRLHGLIRDNSLKLGSFVLASGQTSDYLFQLSQTLLLPEGAALIGEIIVEFMRNHDIDCLGGLELGGTSIASTVAVVSQFRGWPVHAFFVRKEAKTHGPKQKIDGHIHGEAEIIIVDDVVTKGGSVLKAVEGIGKYRKFVHRALAVIDREEGATEALAGCGIELSAIFRTSDFLRIEPLDRPRDF